MRELTLLLVAANGGGGAILHGPGQLEAVFSLRRERPYGEGVHRAQGSAAPRFAASASAIDFLPDFQIFAVQATKTCFLCAMPGHEIRDCHNEICFNCDSPGHKARVRTERRKNTVLTRRVSVQDCHQPHRARIYCNYCNKVGHTVQVRTLAWPGLLLSSHAVYLCSQECDANRYRKLSNQRQKKTIYCFNCGGAGHFGWDCDGGSRGGGGGGNYYTPQASKKARYNDNDRRSWT
jgi:hypothetical protein